MGDAEGLLARARERYQARDLRGALALLQQCHDATGDPNLLFNIAQVMRELHDCSGAVENYRRYTEAAPEGERVADATKQILKLKADCGVVKLERKATDPPPPPHREPSPSPIEKPPSDSLTILGWTSCGASVVAAAAATYFGVQSYSAKRDIEQVQQQPHFEASYLQTRLDDFYRDRTWAVGLGITSAVTAAVGLYLLIVATPQQRQQARVIAQPGKSLDLQLHF